MNYLLSFVVLCFLLSGCATALGPVGKADSAPSLKYDQTPRVRERGPGRIPKTVSARVATRNAPPGAIKASFSGAIHPDQFRPQLSPKTISEKSPLRSLRSLR